MITNIRLDGPKCFRDKLKEDCNYSFGFNLYFSHSGR